MSLININMYYKRRKENLKTISVKQNTTQKVIASTFYILKLKH
jgi:hypothetical protein